MKATASDDRDPREPSGQPRLGRQGRAWFRQRVPLALAGTYHYNARGDALRVALVDWFTARAADFVIWTAHETYGGPGFSAGAWSIKEEALRSALRAARYECEGWLAAESNGARFATIQEWLSAEARGEIPDSRVEEPEARTLLDGGALELYLNAVKRIRKRRRSCADCGAEFEPPAMNVTRCVGCCSVQRAKRDARKQKWDAETRRRAGGKR